MSPTRSKRPQERSGQASVEFVAVLPALAVCLILAGQAVAAGWALWSAGNRRARGGAGRARRRETRRPRPGVRFPARLRGGAVIRSGDGVRVKVRVPALLPGVELPSVAASSTLDATGG